MKTFELVEIYDQIEKMEIWQNQLINNEKYKEAFNITLKLIKIGEEIDDSILKKEQKKNLKRIKKFLSENLEKKRNHERLREYSSDLNRALSEKNLTEASQIAARIRNIYQKKIKEEPESFLKKLLVKERDLSHKKIRKIKKRVEEKIKSQNYDDVPQLLDEGKQLIKTELNTKISENFQIFYNTIQEKLNQKN